MEVKVGVQHSTRELSIESTLSTDEVEKLVATALADPGGRLVMTDERGKRIIVPSTSVAYVEIAESEGRRVGFVAG